MKPASRASPAAEDAAPIFVVDTTPSPDVFGSQPSGNAPNNSVIGEAPLRGEDAADDDVIVYEAPHPRLRKGTSPLMVVSSPCRPAADIPSSPTQAASSPRPSDPTPIDAVAMSFVSHADPDLILSTQVQARKKIGLKPTPRSRKMAKKERAAARRREERKMFNMTSFGLSMQERTALEEGSTIQNDERYAERRRGDSDVEWGTEDEGAVEEVLSSIGDMDLDGDVGDTAAFVGFAQRMEGLRGAETITDLEDIARMKEEDEETDSDEETTSQGEEDIFDAEERQEIGEIPDVDGEGDSDVESDFKQGSWADRDEGFLEHIDVSEFNYYKINFSVISSRCYLTRMRTYKMHRSKRLNKANL